MRHPSIEYRDFSGGLNVDTAPDGLMDNELLVADNVDFSLRGAAKKRKGSVALNAESYNAKVERVIEWPRNDGTKQLLAVMTSGDPAVSKLYAIADDGEATEICTLNKPDIGWFVWQDKFYFVDGEVYRKYNGTDVTWAAPPTPEATFGVGSYTVPNMPQVPPGTYRCRITFVNADGVESTPSPAKTVTLPSENTLRWYNIPCAPSDSGTTQRRLYRTKSSGNSNEFYLVGTIHNNTDTYSSYDFQDNRSDSMLTEEQIVATRDLTSVNRCNHAVFHPKSQRVFFSGNPQDMAAVYYTDSGAPHQHVSGQKRYPPSGFGAVTSLTVFGDSVIAHYPNGHMRWEGIDPAIDVTWYQLPINSGPVSPLAVCLVPNAMSYVSQGGVQLVSPAALATDYVLQPGESLVRNILEGRAASIVTSAASLGDVCAIYDEIRGRYMMAYSEEGNGNDRILVMAWNGHMPCSVWKGIRANHFCLRANGDLLAATDNYILKLEQHNYTDPTGNVEMVIRTKPINMGQVGRKKLFSLYVTAGKANSNLTVEVQGDSDTIYGSVPCDGKRHEVRCRTKGRGFEAQLANRHASDAILLALEFEYKGLTAKEVSKYA